MAAHPLPQAILNWLRQGYPEGIPRTDYVPLLEVLHRKLTDSEVEMIVELLVTNGDSQITREDIEQAIKDRLLQTPGEAEISRVAARLAGGGWPLSGLSKVRHQAGG